MADLQFPALPRRACPLIDVAVAVRTFSIRENSAHSITTSRLILNLSIFRQLDPLLARLLSDSGLPAWKEDRDFASVSVYEISDRKSRNGMVIRGESNGNREMVATLGKLD